MLTKEIHQKLLDLADAHQAADEYKRGHYGWVGGACSIGCTIRDAKKLNLIPYGVLESSHSEWGRVSGVGEHIAQLQDCIFEGLTGPAQRSWTPKFLRAIVPPKSGSRSFAMVWPQFAHWLLTTELMPLTQDSPNVLKAIEGVAAVSY